MSEFYTENIKNERRKRNRRRLIAFICFMGVLVSSLVGFIWRIGNMSIALNVVMPVGHLLIEENEKDGKNEIYRGL